MNPPHPVQSVALTCDFLRAQACLQGFVNFQPRNLAWLERVIGAKDTWARWGVKISVISVPSDADAFERCLGNKAVFSEYTNDSDQAWASLYDVEDTAIFPAVFDELLQHDLVVGFELPPTLKRAIHGAGKRYISFYIHPVRFLRDLCFFVTTNCSDTAALIAECEVSPHQIDFQVRRFKALFSRLRLPALALPDDVPVLVGQTEKDSVLIHSGRFATWGDYEDELARMLEAYPELIFLEHPYRPNSTVLTEYLRGRHKKTVISVRANSYGVIFSPTKIPFFLTLSSSLGTEARYAGQDCTFLLDEPCEKFIVSGVDIPRACIVSHAVLQDEFWKNIFSGAKRRKKARVNVAADDFPLGDHYIRNSLDSWAFRALQFGVNLDPVRKLILPATALSQDRLSTLNSVLCAEPPNEPNQMGTSECTPMPWGYVEILPKPLTVGESATLEFTHFGASCYLVEGFHAPESWGVWSSGKYAKLGLPLDLAGAAEVEIIISMTVKVFGGILALAPVLQITMDGREKGFVLFRDSYNSEQEIAFSGRLKQPICQIEFQISHTGNPSLLTQSADNRELGFGLCAFNVAVSSVDDAQPNKGKFQHQAQFWGVSEGEATLDAVSYVPPEKVSWP